MDLGLQDRVAIVTGASKGIGLAVARTLAQEGAHVLAVARDAGPLAGLDGVTPVAADLTDPDSAAAIVRRATDEHGRVDVLVNNVGAVRLRLDGFLALTDADFAWAMDLNFFTTLRMSRAALAPMVGQGRGTIVNIASVNAFFQPDGATVDYGAARPPSSTSPRRWRRSSGRAASASTPSRPAPWRPTSGSASTASRPPWRR
jgi:NAD(P)-dependent dehydrogenase (short-subunit alcohol dehydrogenase family)